MSDKTGIEWTDATWNPVTGCTKVAKVHGARPGPANTNWKGGRTVTSAGYVLVKAPDHPAADSRGYVYEHRLVMERTLGRPLVKGERVRHLNDIPGDNDPINLTLVRPLDRLSVTACACGCGVTMTALDQSGRRRRFVTGHNSLARGVRTGRRPKSETAKGLDPLWRAECLGGFAGLCAYGCGQSATQWDHLIPWSRGGSFATPGNAVPSCGACNLAKSDDPDTWSWIDKAMSVAEPGAMFEVVALALAWGNLEVPA